MKKTMFLVLALLLVGSTAFAAAPDRVGHFDIGVSAAGAFNSDSDNTGFYSMAISYGLTEWFAIGVEAGWQEASGDLDAEDLGIVPILADLTLRVPYSAVQIHEDLVPYLTVGLGYTAAYVTDENGTGPTNNGDDVDDSGFGWKIGGGFDWFFHPNWALNFEVAYYDSSLDLPGSSINDTDFVTVGGGLKYAF